MKMKSATKCEEVSYWRIDERWYGRHVAERRLSAIGREFVRWSIGLAIEKKAARSVLAKSCDTHTHTHARVALDLNTVDVLFDASSDEIDHSILRFLLDVPSLRYLSVKNRVRSRFSRSR